MCVFLLFFFLVANIYSPVEWNVCASSLLLVPSTWFSSILCKCIHYLLILFFFETEYEQKLSVLAYFLALFMATVAHKHLYSNIWRRSIYGIVWFGQTHEISSKGNDAGRLNVDNCEDVENSSARKQSFLISPPIEHTPPKAMNFVVRRGVDAPFSRKQNGTGSNSPSRIVSTITLPSFPNKSAKPENGSRFIEKFRESARSESFAHFVANQVTKDPFPLDIDAPIPLPRLSEWVGADALKGFRV